MDMARRWESRMTKPAKATVIKTRTVHMYAELWRASFCVLEAGRRERCGSSWQFLSSAVLTAFAFEAYLNHIGPQVISCWSGPERLSPLEKFDLLCELMKVDFAGGKSARPYQTVVELFEVRNVMAHGKTKSIKPHHETRDINNKLDSDLGQRLVAPWEKQIKTGDFAARAREDVEVVLKKLHTRLPKPKERLFACGMGINSATPIPMR
jgi:hypothetical protein